jgi:beta-lactamase regulating signal transducer with metallopeptidase domain
MNAETVWSLLIKGSAILIVAGLVTLAMRRSSASRRHVVWLAALCAILLVPVAEIQLPNWNVPANRAALVTPLLPPVALQPIVQAPGYHGLFTVSPVFTPHAPAPETPPFDYPAVIRVAWIVGASALLAWTAFGLLMVGLLVRRGTRSDTAEEIGREAAPGIRILVCPKLRVPAMAGIIRPSILLPAEALLWDRRRLRMVIAHEAAHIRRRDWLWQLLAQSAWAIHFFNPLAWMALKQLRKESEIACDDFVLGLGFEPASYAHALLDIARTSRFQIASTVGMARSKNVEGRLKSIVDDHRNRNWVSGKTVLSVLAATLVVATPVALLKAIPVIAANHGVASKVAKRDGPALPQIPWSRSNEVEPNVFLAKNGVAGLPGGLRVKLIAISTNGQAGLWSADGKPVPDEALWAVSSGKYWLANGFHKWSSGFSKQFAAFPRSFHFELESETDAAPSTTTELVAPVAATPQQRLNPRLAGADARIPEVRLDAYDPAYGVIMLCIPSRAEKATVRFGVTNGNWQTIADVRIQDPVSASQIGRGGADGNGHPLDECGITLSPSPKLWHLDLGMHEHAVNLPEGAAPLSPALARRAMAFDKNGQSIDLGESPGDGGPSYTISAQKFSQIARVVVQTTPYLWAEFRDIPLRPDYDNEEATRLESGIRGTATGIAPGFSKKLGNGVTVSVKSVTKFALDGGVWKMDGQPSWRADGEVLAQRPNIESFPYRVQVRDLIPTHLEIGYDGLSSDSSTCERVATQVDPTVWPPVIGPDSAYDSWFSAKAKTGAMRIGVANGTWTTISSHEVDMPELPAIASDPDNGMKKQERTGFEVILGNQCAIRDMADGSQTKLESKPLAEYAVRVVARLKSGEQRVLSYGMSERRGSIYPVPARHGEWTEGYSKMIASEVKSVEIQARPYEWVEFDKIALTHK